MLVNPLVHTRHPRWRDGDPAPGMPRMAGKASVRTLTTHRAACALTVLLTGLAAGAAVPGPVAGGDGDREVERLGSALERLLASVRWRRAEWSVLVVSLDRGDTLFAHEPDAPRAPASNLKLLTTAAALRELGPDFRFRTYLVTDGAVSDSVLRGDLIVYGTGDPGISDRFYPDRNSVFDQLADQLLSKGIRTVEGDLVGDASLLPGPVRPTGWDAADLNDHFAPGVSALSFNENVVSIRIEPAPRSGWRPIVHSLPDHADLPINNQAVTVEGRGRVFISRDHPLDSIRVTGQIQRAGRDVWRQLTVPDPTSFTMSVFRSVLEERGITVQGTIRTVTEATSSVVTGRRVAAPALGTPRARILATHVSPSLRDYLTVVNKRSNNLFAELIFRTLGRVHFGDASPEGSARAVAEAAVGLGVDTSGVVQLDGSGLSAGNRVRASTFVSVLEGMAGSDLWDEYWHTLPEAGNRRELPRMYRTPAAGNLRAKTGTIERVSALSGVVQSRDGERLAFSILVNGTPSTNGAKRIENEIGVQLASFQRGPEDRPLSIAQLPPPPSRVDSGGPSRHRVASGESFDAIARRYGVTLEDLMAANPEIEPRRLQIGEWLEIPPVSSSLGGVRAR